MLRTLDAKRLKTNAGKTLLKEVIKIAQERLNIYEQRSIARVATILDARFKKIGFQSDSNFDEGKKLLKEALKKEFDLNPSAVNVLPTSSPEPEIEVPDPNNIFGFVREERVANTITSSTAQATIIIDNYLKEPVIDFKTDPLEYLRNNFPQLLNVAAQYLSTPGTSVPSEQLFSSAGGIISDL